MNLAEHNLDVILKSIWSIVKREKYNKEEKIKNLICKLLLKKDFCSKRADEMNQFQIFRMIWCMNIIDPQGYQKLLDEYYCILFMLLDKIRNDFNSNSYNMYSQF